MPSHNIYEDELEQAALEWFEELGYETAFAPDISPGGDYPERSDYSDIILEERLKDALKRINPDLPQEALDDAMHQILVPLNPALIDNNRLFQKMVTDGVNATFRAIPTGLSKNILR
jgi:type I restriction enzyme R subunit